MQRDARKPAKQERSRRTIDALLEPTARIVGDVGLETATTNRIAEVAGVSTGSLYQYFPCKEALLAALIEREARADLEEMRKVIDEARTMPLDIAMDPTLRVVVGRHARSPALYRWMLTYVPLAISGTWLTVGERRSSGTAGISPARRR